MNRGLGFVLAAVLVFGLATDPLWCPDGCSSAAHSHAGATLPSGCLTCGFPAVLVAHEPAIPTIVTTPTQPIIAAVALASGLVDGPYHPPKFLAVNLS